MSVYFMFLVYIFCNSLYVNLHVFQRMVSGAPGRKKDHAPKHVVKEKYGRIESVTAHLLNMVGKDVTEKIKNLVHVTKRNVQVSWWGEGRWKTFLTSILH